MAKVGRPISITEEVMQSLEKSFRDGAHVYEAAEIAGISAETYYAHMRLGGVFSDRMSLAREYITELARGVIARAIKKQDRETAKWWMERKNKKEFSPRTELSGPDGESLKIEIIEDTTLKDANEDETSDKEL